MVFLSVNGDLFFYYKIAMRISGVWPQDRNNRVSTLIFWASLILKTTIVISHLIDPFGRCPSKNFSGGSFFTTYSAMVTIIIQICFRWNGPRVLGMIKSMIDDWTIANRMEREIMIKHEKSMFWNILLGFYILGGYMKPFVRALSMWANHKSIPKRQICAILPTDEFPIIMIVIYCINIFVSVLTLTMNMFHSMLLVTFASYLAAKYEILKNQFLEVLSKTRKNNTNRKTFGKLVDSHNKFLAFANDLEGCFHFAIGLQIIFLFQVGLCLRAMQLGGALKNTEYMNVIKVLVHIFRTLVAVFAIYNAGEKITTYSEDIPKSVSQCNWCELPKSSLIDYRIVVSMLHCPKKLTAMKFYNLNHVTFRYLCATTYSLMAIFTNLEKK